MGIKKGGGYTKTPTRNNHLYFYRFRTIVEYK